MGFLSFLTQGKQKDVTTRSSSTSTTSLPDWYNAYTSNLASRATAAANQPYQPYTGQRVAGLSTGEREAEQFARDRLTAWEPTLGAATSATRNAANFDPSQVSRFMSPFTSGVVDEIGRVGRENFNAIGGTADLMRSEFTGSGNWGSSRYMNALAEASGRNERDILGQQARALETGYRGAMDDYSGWADRGLGAAGQLGGLAQLQQQLGLGAAGALEDFGEKERMLSQAGLDVGYGNYLDQRDFGIDRALKASQVMQGQQIPTTVSTTGTQTTPTYQASPLQQLTGLVGLGAGVKTLFSKKGGRVPAYKRGGRIPSRYRRGGLAMAGAY